MDFVLNKPVDHPKFVMLIIHGMSEFAERYDHFSNFLNEHQIAVFCDDLPGHGKKVKSPEDVGFFAEKKGWEYVLKLVAEKATYLKEQYPETPLVLFGHSMGSIILRGVMVSYPEVADRFILSGTLAGKGLQGMFDIALSGAVAKLFGKRTRPKVFDKMAFWGFNKRIANARTSKDWLSRDERIVDDFVNNPQCMQLFTAQFYNDMTRGLHFVSQLGNVSKGNLNAPVLLVSGSEDPAGTYGKGVRKVFDLLNAAGYKKVQMKLFEGGRHEMINEINKEEVYVFILTWIENQSRQDESQVE